MSWESLLDDYLALQLIRTGLFIGIFLFSTSYLIPKGILFYLDWKQKRKFGILGSSITFCTGGVFLLVYLLIKSVSS
ncbi:MAG: hypothetical protein A3E80_02365 [Chlamydiae bacterium RIFCSPHIGHO2_12_FULL_49_9]|nr:MAG: hypothetical protein A3E80_02365 [Chlamydiae bacterium RIFCSPHIGHO2_12_FULL_49_9]